MRDYGMLLEKTIEENWGQPTTPFYFANLFKALRKLNKFPKDLAD